jgi:NAD(P)H-quinone oxidoreductase subunit 5
LWYGNLALIYKGVTALMSDMPMVVVPLSLSVIEIAFGILAGFFIMKLGIYRNYPWLYAKLLNISQPYKTVLMYKSKSL